MRVLLEVLHIVIGIFAAMLIAALATWSYPLAEKDIWLVAYAAMVAVALMGVGPIRRAYEEDRQALNATKPADTDA